MRLSMSSLLYNFFKKGRSFLSRTEPPEPPHLLYVPALSKGQGFDQMQVDLDADAW